jgi:cellulose synthase/poly-beta-1,6-N-acetylglucosamine synthase-like glycosyltransferase
MKVSIAVPAYNEERNIAQLIDSLRTQRTQHAEIVEIVVIASGCTDRTAAIVRERQSRAGIPIVLLDEAERRGKVAAINTYLSERHPDVDAVCLCSADLLVTRDVIEKLVCCLRDNPDVGMCGGRPMPTNGMGTFTGEATRFLWQMHHRVAQESPKLGELIMIRANLAGHLPQQCAVDEASLEQMVCRDGYRLAYVGDAVVHNHGPETFREFLRQRRRIAAGHYWLREISGYSVSTMNAMRVVRLTLSELARSAPRASLYIVATIFTEVLSRALGYLDFRTNRNKHTIWRVSESTKQVMTEELRPQYSHVSEQIVDAAEASATRAALGAIGAGASSAAASHPS